jgi:hypothetical protein
MIYIPVSVAELVDKVTILKLKLNNITDNDKLINIKKEYDELNLLLNLAGINECDENFLKMLEINQKIYTLQDFLMLKNNDDEFLRLSKMLHQYNNERSRIKKEINIKFKSEIIEEKSYK